MPHPLTRRLLSRRRLLIVAGLMLLSPMALADGPWQRLEAASELLGGTTPATEGLVLELPHVSEDGSAVPLTVSFDGSLADDDYLSEIHLFATGNPSPEIVSFSLGPAAGLPEISTRVRLNETQQVIAIARTQQGETFATAREVRITVSGCLMRGDDQGPEPLANPRVSLPERFTAGVPGEVRTLISHPMETGLREGSDGETLPRHIIERFTVTLDGETAFAADLHQSISANPYLRFHLAPQEDAELVIEWQDDSGESARHEARLSVG
ncbi:thiosulfate oxidation carrier complex protein SoxZ [Halomonas sp. JS92-SW72]|uniref:thiosulfate oxidation carrier complex protein SoxZ n=1 Tax=Halomonas sp. JS92-SW72 TaxID=2306583 RepID=UPI000E5B565F|nr:thiosulfate oxidation carrier complex protein SoxZ [Halomonas sp. JS92-SW72]AXY42369.1 thiosulfate oxidation carrier complex protein SoxZ [Halomonas sp. JS92-SW72]